MIVVLLILWSQNLTYSPFHRLQHDLWRLDDLSTLSSCLFLASSTVWKSKRMEIQLNFGLFQRMNMTIIYNMKSKSYLFRIPPTPAWSLDGRPLHVVLLPLLGLLHGLEVQKNRNTVKIWLISFQCVNMTIVVIWSQNHTYSGFHRLQNDLWMDDVFTLSSCLFLASYLFLASSTVWKSKRIEIQSKFGLF